MKPWKRILLNLFLPGLISGFGMGTAIAIGGFFNEKRIEARDIVFLPAGLLFIAAYAIIFSIIPAAVSTAAIACARARPSVKAVDWASGVASAASP